jgi:hypothetical protein
MAGFFSDVDDTVNDTVGWENILKALAAYFTGGTSMAAPNGGFEFLPSGEMTVADGASAIGGSSGGTNFLSNLFSGSEGSSGTFVPDLSGLSTYADIGIDPATTAFDSNMGTYDPASKYYNLNQSSLIDDLLSKQRQQSMTNFGNQIQQQSAQQMAQLNQGGDFGMGMRQGQAVPQAILSSLLDPAVALKAYRPTLI